MDRRRHQLHHQVPHDGNQVPYSAAALLAALLQKPGRVRLTAHAPSKQTVQTRLVAQSKPLTIAGRFI